MSYENCPEGYVLQYKQDNGEWLDYPLDGITVTKNGTTIVGRLYSSDLKAGAGVSDEFIVNNIIKTIASEKAKATVEALSTTDTEMIIDSSSKPVQIPVPKGFGIAKDSATVIDEGIVIEDTRTGHNGDQWVWVPVDLQTVNGVKKATSMYDTISATKLTGTTATTTKKSKNILGTLTINGSTVNFTRGSIGTDTSYREPDLIKVTDGDRFGSGGIATAGFSSAQKMAEAFVEDYNGMINSIEKYGGFYVGRYELTGNLSTPKMQPGDTIFGKSWYHLYNTCRKFMGNTDTGVSTMIWGCQWDMICKFISEKGTTVSITDSSTYGNYKNVRVLANNGQSTAKYAGTDQILETGQTKYTMTHNIYDIAGNYEEYTQEACKFLEGRALRRRKK